MPRSAPPPLDPAPTEWWGRITSNRSRRVDTAQRADRNQPSPNAPCATPPHVPPAPNSDGVVPCRANSCGRRKRTESNGGWPGGGAAGSRNRLAAVGPKSGSTNLPAASTQSARRSSSASDSPSSRSGTCPPGFPIRRPEPRSPLPVLARCPSAAGRPGPAECSVTSSLATDMGRRPGRVAWADASSLGSTMGLTAARPKLACKRACRHREHVRCGTLHMNPEALGSDGNLCMRSF